MSRSRLLLLAVALAFPEAARSGGRRPTQAQWDEARQKAAIVRALLGKKRPGDDAILAALPNGYQYRPLQGKARTEFNRQVWNITRRRLGVVDRGKGETMVTPEDLQELINAHGGLIRAYERHIPPPGAGQTGEPDASTGPADETPAGPGSDTTDGSTEDRPAEPAPAPAPRKEEAPQAGPEEPPAPATPEEAAADPNLAQTPFDFTPAELAPPPKRDGGTPFFGGGPNAGGGSGGGPFGGPGAAGGSSGGGSGGGSPGPQAAPVRAGGVSGRDYAGASGKLSRLQGHAGTLFGPSSDAGAPPGGGPPRPGAWGAPAGGPGAGGGSPGGAAPPAAYGAAGAGARSRGGRAGAAGRAQGGAGRDAAVPAPVRAPGAPSGGSQGGGAAAAPPAPGALRGHAAWKDLPELAGGRPDGPQAPALTEQDLRDLAEVRRLVELLAKGGRFDRASMLAAIRRVPLGGARREELLRRLRSLISISGRPLTREEAREALELARALGIVLDGQSSLMLLRALEGYAGEPQDAEPEGFWTRLWRWLKKVFADFYIR